MRASLRSGRTILLAVVAAAGAGRAPAAALSIEERLSALEDEVRALRAENQQLRRDLGGVSAGVAASPSTKTDANPGLAAVKPAGKAHVVTINGLVQAQAEFGDRGDSRGAASDRVRLRRVRLGAAGRFLEELDFKVEGEYAGAGVTLTDAFVNWSHWSAANVKAGQFKTPFGHEFLASDPRLFTIERTLGSDRLTLSRQVGAQVSGDFFEKRLGYAAGAFNGSGQNVSTNDNDNFTYVARLAGAPWQGRLFGQAAKLTAGVNGFWSSDRALGVPGDFGFAGNSFTGKRRGAGLDAQFQAGRFELWAEHLTVRFRPLGGAPAAERDAESWQALGTCFVVPRQLQLAVRFDQFDPNDRLAADETETWTLGANYFIKGDDLKLQLNYLLIDAPAPAAKQEQLQLRTQVIF